MPIKEFQCGECSHTSSALVPVDCYERDRQCDNCGNLTTQRQIMSPTRTTFKFADASGDKRVRRLKCRSTAKRQ